MKITIHTPQEQPRPLTEEEIEELAAMLHIKIMAAIGLVVLIIIAIWR